MSTWTAPVTWINGAVTAASMNTELTNHLNFLKGSLDLITNSTTADTSNTTQLRIKRASSGLTAFDASVTGDAAMRFRVAADGALAWGDGTGAADIALYRIGADHLRLDDRLTLQRALVSDIALSAYVAADTESRLAILASGEIQWSAGSGVQDTNLYRSAASLLKTDDNLLVSGYIALGTSDTSLIRDGVGILRVAASGVSATLRLEGIAGALQVNNVQVVSARRTGWTAATGTETRSTFATSTVTLPQLAERVAAIIDDLTAHGLIGT